MRKGTKIALKQGEIMIICEVFSLHLIGINRGLERDFTILIIQLIRAAFERDIDVVEEI